MSKPCLRKLKLTTISLDLRNRIKYNLAMNGFSNVTSATKIDGNIYIQWILGLILKT